jgi:hypothetical protein
MHHTQTNHSDTHNTLTTTYNLYDTRKRSAAFLGQGKHDLACRDADCLWDLSLGQCTGDGKFDWEVFWVGCGWFFLGGGGEGEEELQDTYCSLFSQDDARFQTALFMLYIIY